MARFDGEGFDELVADLKDKSELMGEAADEILSAGAKVVADCWKSAAEKSGLRDTGDMIESIKPSKITESSGVKSIDVLPQGKDRKGVRNVEKAYINHYGAKKIKATHFVTDAIDQAEVAAVDAMADVWYKKLESE